MSEIGKVVKLGVYRNMEPGASSGYEIVGNVRLYEGYGTYVRISELAEVTFEPLKDGAVIQGALRALDAAELKARENLQRTLDQIKDQRAQLLQLTHAPSAIPTECPKCGPSCQCDIAWNE